MKNSKKIWSSRGALVLYVISAAACSGLLSASILKSLNNHIDYGLVALITLISALFSIVAVIACLGFCQSKENNEHLSRHKAYLETYTEYVSDLIELSSRRWLEVQNRVHLVLAPLSADSVSNLGTLNQILTALQARLESIISLKASNDLARLIEAKELASSPLHLQRNALFSVKEASIPDLPVEKWRPTIESLLTSVENEVQAVTKTA